LETRWNRTKQGIQRDGSKIGKTLHTKRDGFIFGSGVEEWLWWASGVLLGCDLGGETEVFDEGKLFDEAGYHRDEGKVFDEKSERE
jgi:hypothetical protein